MARLDLQCFCLVYLSHVPTALGEAFPLDNICAHALSSKLALPKALSHSSFSRLKPKLGFARGQFPGYKALGAVSRSAV